MATGISFRAKVLLIGDFVLDRFVYTTPLRLSREAPVIIVRYDWEEVFPGAGGNTALNLSSIGCEVLPAGIVGGDEEGTKLLKLLRENFTTEGIVTDEGVETVVKTRILSGDYHTSKQQILRIDREPRKLPGEKAVRKLCEYIEESWKEADIVVVSDYGYYTLLPPVKKLVGEMAKKVRIVVDSRYSLKDFRGVFAATPNEGEAREVLGLKEANFENPELVRRLKKELGVEVLLLTRGNKGMVLDDGTTVYRIPISGTDEVVDVTGAGDTVCAVFSAALASGESPVKAALLANYAGGVVVTKKGTKPVKPEEIKAQMERFPVEVEELG